MKNNVVGAQQAKKKRGMRTLTNKERDSCDGPRRPWFQFGLSSESFGFEGF